VISRKVVLRAGMLLSFGLLGACAGPERYVQPQIDDYASQSNPAQPRNESSTSLRVMTLNIAHARGIGMNQILQNSDTARANLDNISDELNQLKPDVLSLQEADRKSFWNGNFDHISFLAKKADFLQAVSGEHVNSTGLAYGTALVAKLDLSNPESIIFSPKEEATAAKGFVVSSINWPGKPCLEVDIVSAHLDFASEETRRQQAAEIIALLKQRDRPIILTGDFNTGWLKKNSAVRKLANELDLHAFDPDAESSQNTFLKQNRRLDWILVSKEIQFLTYEAVEPAVSDHLGVISDLSIDSSCGL